METKQLDFDLGETLHGDWSENYTAINGHCLVRLRSRIQKNDMTFVGRRSRNSRTGLTYLYLMFLSSALLEAMSMA